MATLYRRATAIDNRPTLLNNGIQPSSPVLWAIYGALNQPAFNRHRLNAEKLIDSRLIVQLDRFRLHADCTRAPTPSRLLGVACQRQMSTGTVLRVTTSLATLPRISRRMPLRPCEAMTIRSQPLSAAYSTIPSAGKRSFTCSVSQDCPSFSAVAFTASRARVAAIVTFSS